MSKFYGTLVNERGESTRAAHRFITATAASQHGALQVRVYIDGAGRTVAQVDRIPWMGNGHEQAHRIAEVVLHDPATDR